MGLAAYYIWVLSRMCDRLLPHGWNQQPDRIRAKKVLAILYLTPAPSNLYPHFYGKPGKRYYFQPSLWATVYTPVLITHPGRDERK
jgi:hypothetical protein